MTTQLESSINEAKRAVQTRVGSAAMVSANALMDLIGAARHALHLRGVIASAIATSERISDGATVCDEWAVELEVMRRAVCLPADGKRGAA